MGSYTVADEDSDIVTKLDFLARTIIEGVGQKMTVKEMHDAAEMHLEAVGRKNGLSASLSKSKCFSSYIAPLLFIDPIDVGQSLTSYI